MKNRKGLSDVVTTLIFILLAIVAIGIVWFIFQGLANDATGGIELNQKCIGMDVRVTGVGVCDASGCAVDITRGVGSSEAFDGVRVVVTNGNTSQSYEAVGNIEVGTTSNIDATGVATPTEVTVAPYFDVDGVNQVCPNPTTFQI